MQLTKAKEKELVVGNVQGQMTKNRQLMSLHLRKSNVFFDGCLMP